MLRRGASLAVVTLTNQAQLTADLLVVGLVLGAAGAGDYYLAGQVLVAGLLFANAAGQIALARLLGPGRRSRAVSRRAARRPQAPDLRSPPSRHWASAAWPPRSVPVLFGAEHAGAAQALLWLLPWFVLQHPTTLLQAALTAARREGQVVRANGVAIAVLLSGLAVAALHPGLAGFALARSVAEAARLAALWLSLRPTPAAAAARASR